MSKFNDIYQNIYKECQEPLENSRKQTIKKAVMIFVLLLILGIILSKILENPMFIIIFLFLGFLIAITSGKKSQYNAMFKEKVIKTFVREYSDQLEYKQNGGVTPSVYVQGEFESFDRYSAEDGIRGILEEYYTINMSEVHTERESRDEDGRKTYSTVFRGLFAQVEFDKFVPGAIKIRRNRNKLFGNSNSRIEMDSGEFEKIYDIYAQDKIIAMQLFTADIIQMFIDFKERNKITPELTIKGNRLYIRFQTGDIFEAKVLKKALDYETLYKYYDTIEFTMGITRKLLKNISETEI